MGGSLSVVAHPVPAGDVDYQGIAERSGAMIGGWNQESEVGGAKRRLAPLRRAACAALERKYNSYSNERGEWGTPHSREVMPFNAIVSIKSIGYNQFSMFNGRVERRIERHSME